MTEQEQTVRFSADLDRFIEQYRLEYDLTYATIVGCLTIKATMMTLESLED